MKKISLCFFALIFCLMSVLCRAQQADIDLHPSCPLCGMDRHHYAESRMKIEYVDGSSLGTCSIHCTAMEMVTHREKIISDIYVADYYTKNMVDAKKAFWVIGGDRPGVMTKRAKWAFEHKDRAEQFIGKHGGQIASFDDAMTATFRDMHEDIKSLRRKKARHTATLGDIKEHPECAYCGMKREQYAYSRMLTRYNDGTATGTCSIHCTSIDLALKTDAMPEVILVGDYNTKRLIDAEKAFWVIGGNKTGVMSIRGKWAFEQRTGADAFIRENGGQVASFDEAMEASFEDMYEILR